MKSAAFLETFVDYPPSQLPPSFAVDQIIKDVERRSMEKMRKEKAK